MCRKATMSNFRLLFPSTASAHEHYLYVPLSYELKQSESVMKTKKGSLTCRGGDVERNKHQLKISLDIRLDLIKTLRQDSGS